MVLKDLLSLTKPRLTSLVVLSAAAGLAITPQEVGTSTFLWIIFGIFLVVAAANTVNCYLESDVDALMSRTRNRPLVRGSLKPSTALIFGMSLAALSFVVLLWKSNLITAVLGLLGFALYVAFYTPMKRRSMLALFAGAIPGAIPPMMGWTAATNQINTTACLLFGILFFWQVPHFIAISLFREKEYTNAGLKTFPGTLGLRSAQTHMILYSAFLIFITFLPFPLGLAGVYYLSTALILGLLFTGLCVASFFALKPLNWSRIIFFGSLAYLPLVLGMWVLDHWLTRSA